MTELTPSQMALVANLKDLEGYRLLLRSIQESIDIMTESLEADDTDDRSLRLLAAWRIARRLFSTLSASPETVAAELTAMLTEVPAPATTVQDLLGNPLRAPEERFAEQRWGVSDITSMEED